MLTNYTIENNGYFFLHLSATEGFPNAILEIAILNIFLYLSSYEGFPNALNSSKTSFSKRSYEKDSTHCLAVNEKCSLPSSSSIAFIP